jgi:HD-GYP domain-containing protein (c-di-GMP phosphodiesterase class II)
MYYKGRILEKFAEMFGAMSYGTTIAGRACDLYKKEGRSYLHLFSREKINDEFEIASKELAALGFEEEADSLFNRGRATIDQGVGSFLLMPISFGGKVIGIFTISSHQESDPEHILGENIEQKFVPIAQMLSLVLYMEKISYDKSEEMGRLLISSIDAKDEYQATHSLNVRTMIDMFIDELSRDRELRERVENMGFKLTVDKIEKLRLAALLHDMGKIFVPSEILRKYGLNKEELLVRKMHSYCTYNILNRSDTLCDIAAIASMHHARYAIPMEKYETSFIGYPFDRWGQKGFTPESQIIALADTFNSIVRSRPDRKGLSVSEALKILAKDDHKFHGGFRDVFLTIVRRVEQNLSKGKYPPQQAKEYRSCLWLEEPDKAEGKVDNQYSELHGFLDEIRFNNLGIISVMDLNDALFLMDEDISIEDKKAQVTKIKDEYIVLSLRNIPKEQGFIWINKLHDKLKSLSFTGKIAFAFVSKRGCPADIHKIYNSLVDGLKDIKNEPVHYYLNPEMYCLTKG